jgi:Zn-dependent M28 family amino/carboxypeptidase
VSRRHWAAVLARLVLLALALAALLAFVVQPFGKPLRPSHHIAVYPSHLEAHVRALSQRFAPRSVAHVTNVEAAANYVRDQWRAVGATVREQVYLHQGQRHRNVVARFGPSDGPLLVIGAHYDSHGDTPGADDNASGVAGLIELARLFAEQPPPRPVELVAYAAEEPPHFRTEGMGSRQHARALQVAGTEVELMVALEMIGTFRDEPGSQRYPLPGLGLLYPGRGDFIAVVGRPEDWRAARALKASMRGVAPLPVHSINAPPVLAGVDFSDHWSYWQQGMRALMVTDTAFYRNEHYHRPGDTADRLDYRRMGQVVMGVAAFAYRAVPK